MERPELRTAWKHPELREWAAEHRTDLVTAALTLIQGWIAQGKPQGRRTLGMFESWARVIGGILDVADIAGFLTHPRRPHVLTDDDTSVWRAFVTAWWSAHGSNEVTARELHSLAANVLDLGIGDADSQCMRLGHQLSAKRNRVFACYQIRRGGIRHQAAMWHLDRVESSPAQPIDFMGQGELGEL